MSVPSHSFTVTQIPLVHMKSQKLNESYDCKISFCEEEAEAQCGICTERPSAGAMPPAPTRLADFPNAVVLLARSRPVGNKYVQGY